MPNIKKQKSYTLYMIHIPIVVIAAAAMIGSFLISNGSISIMKNQESVLSSVNRGKGSSNSKSQKLADKVKPVKDEKGNNKVDWTPPGYNGQVYKKNMQDVVVALDEVVEDETLVGNEEVAEEIEEVADEEIEDTTAVADAMEQVETRNKWKTLLVGSDYKNLGQLRSQLVRNRNNIRKLTKNVDGTQAQGSDEALQEQLQTMVQERERIKAVIQEHESEFSLLGWVTKFLTGYDSAPIGGVEEDALYEEVEEVLDLIDDETEEGGMEDDDTVTDESSESTEPADEMMMQ